MYRKFVVKVDNIVLEISKHSRKGRTNDFMRRNMKNNKTKKHFCKVNKKWVTVAATSATLLGAGGFLPGVVGTATQPTTVEAATEESNVPEWTANTVHEVEQELEAQNARETSSYQIRWGDTLSALSLATGLTVDEISAQNNIQNPDLIYAGDFLGQNAGTAQPVQEAETAPEETADAGEAQAQEEVVEEAPAEEPVEEAPVETPEESSEVAEEPAEEPIMQPETPDPMETTDEEPEAVVVLPEDPEEEVVEEEVPEPEEVEAVEVEDVTTTEETVNPNDKVVTDQSVAVVADPESHKEPSEAFVMPAQGYLSSGYGYRNNPVDGVRRLHAGLDIAGSGPISAAQSGTVVAAEYHSGWGNYVKIDHGNGLQTLYAHLQDGSTTVSVGDTVSQGQTIGTMGQTGSATGVHLHFEVYVNGLQVDPAPYL